jgi:hypothetical protein
MQSKGECIINEIHFFSETLEGESHNLLSILKITRSVGLRHEMIKLKEGWNSGSIKPRGLWHKD